MTENSPSSLRAGCKSPSLVDHLMVLLGIWALGGACVSAQDLTLTGGSGSMYSTVSLYFYDEFRRPGNISHTYSTTLDPLTMGSANQGYPDSLLNALAAYSLAQTDNSITTSLSSSYYFYPQYRADTSSYSQASLSYDFTVNTAGTLSIDFISPRGIDVLAPGGGQTFTTYMDLWLSKWENGQWVSLYRMPSSYPSQVYFSYSGMYSLRYGELFSAEVDPGLYRLSQYTSNGGLDTRLSLAATPVPEPGSLVLLATVGGIGLLRRRRRPSNEGFLTKGIRNLR